MRIACVHQGYELYGSDRSFAESVAILRAAYPSAEIEVVLPREGPIISLLETAATRISFEPLWVLRRRDLLELATKGLARLPRALSRAARRLRDSDLVYINTCVVADYLVAARWFGGKSLLHIHEIPEGRALDILRALALWSGAEIIFNSHATRATFALPQDRRTHVVYNGIAGPLHPEPLSYDGTRPLRVLMLGRISRIKGQEVLLEAVASLPERMRARLELRIVGSAFEDAERERALAELAAATPYPAHVQIEPFVSDVAPLYQWADVVAVPSRRPESLGRVAIEAMAFGRPPIASAIGGLSEVVAHGSTGWLVPPGDPAALARQLSVIITSPAAWRDFPAAGRARYESCFSSAAAADAIAAIVDAKLHKATSVHSAARRAPAAVDTP